MGCITMVFVLHWFLWQQVTILAAVMTHCGISPNRYGSLSKLDLLGLYNLREICVFNMVIHLVGGEGGSKGP